jgi:hypothetical protein
MGADTTHSPGADSETGGIACAVTGRGRRVGATVEDLGRRLGRTSRNSSQPPLADPPQARSQRGQREPSGRRPGRQPGYGGQTRELVPVEEVDVTIPLKLMQCAHCEQLLLGENLHARAASRTARMGSRGPGGAPFLSLNEAISNKGDGLRFKGGTPDEPSDFSDNTAISNGKNGILVGSAQPDANVDSGGNKGLPNVGPI